MKRSTTSLSRTCDRTGTIEIGLWSLGPFGGLFIATGRIRATRHCSGIVEEFNDELNSLAIPPEMTGASSRRNECGNQAGMLSSPSAVGVRRSRMYKMSTSQQTWAFGIALVFRIGRRYALSVEAAAKKPFRFSAVTVASLSALPRLSVKLRTAIQSCLVRAVRLIRLSRYFISGVMNSGSLD